MTMNQAQKRGKRRPGRKPGVKVKHGGYSLMVRAGELPERRAYLRAYLTEVRAGLVRDLGPLEEDLTSAQRILIDRAISKLAVVRCIEEHVRETGVFKGNELSSVLAKSYVTYCESIRRDVETLGIDRRAAEKTLDPLELAKVIDAENAAQEEDPEKEAGGSGIAQPGAFRAKIHDDQGEAEGELEAR